MSESSASERRKHDRVAAPIPCTLVGEGGTEEPFELIDLSESGVRIRCGHGIEAMTRIHVALVLPGNRINQGEDVRLDTAGVVVWSHAGEDGDYDTGVFFPELDDDERRLLDAYVRSAGA